MCSSFSFEFFCELYWIYDCLKIIKFKNRSRVCPQKGKICIFSGVECSDEIYSAFQFASVKSETLCTNNNKCNNGVTTTTTTTTTTSNPSIAENIIPVVEKVKEQPQQQQQKLQSVTTTNKPVTVTANLFSDYTPTTPIIAVIPPTPRPQTATTKIFANRTEDMNKGFLTFSDEEPGLTRKYPFYYQYIIFLQMFTYPVFKKLFILSTSVLKFEKSI